MATDDQMRNTALHLTERALELLDEVGDSKAISVGVHLQMAIDVMTDAPIATRENVEAFLASPAGQAMMARWDSFDGARRQAAH